jgi:glycerol-3-phosphate acyltransferase PlsX
METPRIAIDAMGGDLAPRAVVEGAVAAARERQLGLLLVGDAATIGGELARFGPVPPDIMVVHAPDAIAMDETPTSALRRKRDSSIAVGVQLVKSDKAAAFVSAGNTGAVMAIATLTLGRAPGIDRPALATVLPTVNGLCLLLDVGANADAKPGYMPQFASLGAAYAARVLGIAEPRVALLNIGEEENKGNEFAREAYARLKASSGIRFIGNVEGKDLARAKADVIVTDAFTGNVALKTAEGAAEFILRELRGAMTSKLHYKLAALVLKPALLKLRSRLDWAEYGAAPLLGLNGLVFIGHGRSDARAIKAAIRTAHTAAGSGLQLAASHQSPSTRGTGTGEAS